MLCCGAACVRLEGCRNDVDLQDTDFCVAV
jgi:hypothetical protein